MEKIYTLNEDGTFSILRNREDVHNNGILHSAVQCWVMNSKGKILIQRRAATKDKSAGKWDVSFGGHCVEAPNNKDILLFNVIKEGQEELGLNIKKECIVKLGEVRYTSQENKNRELLGIFLIEVPDNQEFIFEDGEVSEVQWISSEELYNNILNNSKEYANRLGALSLLQLYGA